LLEGKKERVSRVHRLSTIHRRKVRGVPLRFLPSVGGRGPEGTPESGEEQAADVGSYSEGQGTEKRRTPPVLESSKEGKKGGKRVNLLIQKKPECAGQRILQEDGQGREFSLENKPSRVTTKRTGEFD